MSRKEEKLKAVPNAKSKLILMLFSIALMIFSVTQVYYLALYTLGQEISADKMAVYNWVVKLVSYEEDKEITEQDAYDYDQTE